MTAQPNLYVVGGHAVDGDTGEVVTIAGLQAELAAQKAENAKLKAMVKGLERDVRGWTVRYRQATEDKDQDAREHPCWPVGGHLFVAWRKLCQHPQSAYVPKRFWAVESFLTNPHYGQTLTIRVGRCATAIKGRAYDPYRKPMKNGKAFRGDDWTKWIFESPDKFEDAENHAPLNWQPTLGPAMLAAIDKAETLLENQRKARRAK